MLFPRYLLILLGFLLINISHIYGTDINATSDFDNDIDDEFRREHEQLQQKYKQLRQKYEQLRKDQQQLEVDRKNFDDEKESVRSINTTDVIQLNIGGDILATTRQTLTSLPKSLFSILFNDRWEGRLAIDEKGNTFFDFNPILFRHLLDQLQLSKDKSILPPSDPSLVRPFEKMLKKLDLQHLLLTSSNKNIFTINVNGQLITTQILNSTEKDLITSKSLDKTDVFIDYHPKVFRRFIKFRREKKLLKIDCESKLLTINRQMFDNWTTSCYKQISVLTIPENNLQKHEFESVNKRITNDIDVLRTQTTEQRKAFAKHSNERIGIIQYIREEISQLKQLYNNQISQLNQSLDYHSNKLKTWRALQWKVNIKWKQHAKTIAGGNGAGDKLNQLDWPLGIYVDDQQQTIYVADNFNHRIVRWKLGENNGQVVAGGNGWGNRTNQLSFPTDMIVNQNNKSLIICDQGNRRVVRWSLENQQHIQTIIENIDCFGLKMNENGDLFVSDKVKHEVKRWRKGEREGTIVAGGNGKGNQLNQLNQPTFIFIDGQETVYVSDSGNHRVMKWVKGAKEGVVVAGGQGEGSSLKQLRYPEGLFVNEVGDVYVADYGNDRIVCWSSGSGEGRIVVGGNGRGGGSNQFNGLSGLSFDAGNNLYVTDVSNHRIQRFEVD